MRFTGSVFGYETVDERDGRRIEKYWLSFG